MFDVLRMPSPLTRRSAIRTATGLAATAALGLTAKAQNPPPAANASDSTTRAVTKNRIKQSVIAWCFNPMPVPELAEHSAAIGLQSVELCDPKYWPGLKELGLTCAISSSHGFA